MPLNSLYFAMLLGASFTIISTIAVLGGPSPDQIEAEAPVKEVRLKMLMLRASSITSQHQGVYLIE